jgi:nucleotide-binding universal stress UspA family protein
MYQKILTALDGSATGEKILPWVQDYASRTQALVHLVRAWPSWERLRGESARLRQKRDMANYLKTVSQKLIRTGVKTKTHLRQGHPANVIVNAARRTDSHLLGLTARGESRFERRLLGGIAEKVLRLSPLPILLLNRMTTRPPSRLVVRDRILVPLDGSPLSETALPTALFFARLYGAQVVLQMVWPKVRPSGWKYERMNTIGRIFEKNGVRATARLQVGDPASCILRAQLRPKVSLVVMNSHGRSGFAKMMLGSVTEEVVHGASAPVLIERNRQPKRLFAQDAAKVAALTDACAVGPGS